MDFNPGLTQQGAVEAATHWGDDASLLSHQLNRSLDLANSLWTTVRVCLADILSIDEAVRNLGTFTFVALYLFYAGGQHSLAATDLLRLIERLEELHTKVQGIM